MHPGNARPPLPPRSARVRLDLLYAFEAAARHLSFTAAGEELALSQSAISRQVQQLEANLGAPLFERRHRALVLTEAGLVMQRAVQDSLERLADAGSRVRPAAVSRQVAITCTPGFASFWLIPRLARFTASHPHVDVRIAATLDLVDLERSDIDVAVRFVPGSAGRGPLLFEEEVQPMCAPSLLLDAARPLRRPADLQQHTLLTVDIPGAPTMDWEPWLQVMGLDAVRPSNTLRFTRYSEAVEAAIAGQGVVIGRLPLLAGLVAEGRLVAPFRSRAASRRGYFIEQPARAAGNPHARDFVGWLLAEAASAQAGGQAKPHPRPAGRTAGVGLENPPA